jgi:two-component system NtrC family sensor kinase
MKNIFISLIILNLLQHPASSQDRRLIDSLSIILKKGKEDSTHVNALNQLSDAYLRNNPDTSILYATSALQLSEKIRYKKGVVRAYFLAGGFHFLKGNNSKALEYSSKSLALAREINDTKGITDALSYIGMDYLQMGNHSEALKNFFSALKTSESNGDKMSTGVIYSCIGGVYEAQKNHSEALKNYFLGLRISKSTKNNHSIAGNLHNIAEIYGIQHKYSEALEYYKDALEINLQQGNMQWASYNYDGIGEINLKKSNYDLALNNFFISLKIIKELGDKPAMATCFNDIGEAYIKLKKNSEARKYLNDAVSLALQINDPEDLKISYELLTRLDSLTGNWKSAYENHKLFTFYSDSLLNNESQKKTIQAAMQYEFDKKESLAKAEQEKKDALAKIERQKQRVVKYSSIGGMIILVIFSFVLFKKFTDKKKANAALSKTFDELKSTQQQLIRSEKLAAFGVMASRVSHEIQNPLNFVNNFSELSKEMVDDVIGSDNPEERKQHAELLMANLEKINEHGKRMAIIVKQLQEHSNKGTAHEFFEEN